MKYIIEHLDPEVFDWCMLEYTHINKIVGKKNLIFTNVNDQRLAELGELNQQSVTTMELDNVCILDPFAEKTLAPEDKFDYLIFGGVLGDHPMQRRTEKTLSSQMKAELRNLGPVQMSTDTAVLVSKMIVDGKNFDEIEFHDKLEIELEPNESVILPYRYVVENGKIVLPDGFTEFIKKNRGFD